MELLISSGSSSGADIKLCEFVEEVAHNAEERARLLAACDAGVDHKYDKPKIYQCLRDLLDGKGGPNESIETKLRQLTRQEKLFQLFRAGKLERCRDRTYRFVYRRGDSRGSRSTRQSARTPRPR